MHDPSERRRETKKAEPFRRRLLIESLIRACCLVVAALEDYIERPPEKSKLVGRAR